MRSFNRIRRLAISDEYLFITAILSVTMLPGGLPINPDIRIMIAAAPLLVMSWKIKSASQQSDPPSITTFVALRTMVLIVLALALVVVILRIRFPAPLLVRHDNTWVHHILSGYLFSLCSAVWLAAFFMFTSDARRFRCFWMSLALTLILVACNRPHPYVLW